MLIYPLFLAKRKEQNLVKRLNTLANYKSKLVNLVIKKQEILRKVYVQHKSIDFEKINNIFVSCAYVKIDESNFAQINAQMDQINSLVIIKKSYEKIRKTFSAEIWPYTDEIRMISQYYYSIMGLIEHEYDSFPWKYLLSINKFSNFDITI